MANECRKRQTEYSETQKFCGERCFDLSSSIDTLPVTKTIETSHPQFKSGTVTIQLDEVHNWIFCTEQMDRENIYRLFTLKL